MKDSEKLSKWKEGLTQARWIITPGKQPRASAGEHLFGDIPAQDYIYIANASGTGSKYIQ
jgi:hypothetical protein